MSRFFKGLALLVAVACFTWVAVLWHWQSTQRDMSVQDIGVYLVALPLTLFGFVLLGRWAWAGAAEKQSAAPAAAPAAAAPAPPPEDADRRASAQLLAAEVNCAAGQAVTDVLGALADGKPRPGLDDELRDDAGLPLMTARIRDLDLEGLALDEIEDRVRARQPEWEHQTCRPELQRALAALAPALDAALHALSPWRERLNPADTATPAAGTPMLRVLPAWPPGLTPYELAVAADWLPARVQQTGAVAPARLSLLPAPAPGQQWADAERVLRLLEREQRPDLLLLTACHSALGEASVMQLQAARALYTAATPKAPIAGEGAAALVLAPPAWPADPDADAPPPRLHRIAALQRDKPIDAAGRTTAQTAEKAIEQALTTGPFAPGSIAFAVHDADQHTARAAEALAALLATQPQLQAGDDVLGSGALTGQLVCVAPLFVAALAAAQAAKLDKPCLALSVDDAQQRFAFVVRPATFDPAAPEAAAAA